MHETEWLKTKEACALARCSVTTLYRAIRRGEIACKYLAIDRRGARYSAADCRKLGGFSKPQPPTGDPE